MSSSQNIESKINNLRGQYAKARMARNIDEVIRLEVRIQDAMEDLRLAQIAERAA